MPWSLENYCNPSAKQLKIITSIGTFSLRSILVIIYGNDGFDSAIFSMRLPLILRLPNDGKVYVRNSGQGDDRDELEANEIFSTDKQHSSVLVKCFIRKYFLSRPVLACKQMYLRGSKQDQRLI